MPDDSSSNGRIWQGLKALLFGEREASLRDQIEDAIDEHEEDGEEANGDLSPIERQMLRNLLHFGERTVGDVAVPRGDIIAVAEESGRLPEVMIHQADYYEEEAARKLTVLSKAAGYSVYLVYAICVIAMIFKLYVGTYLAMFNQF